MTPVFDLNCFSRVACSMSAGRLAVFRPFFYLFFRLSNSLIFPGSARRITLTRFPPSRRPLSPLLFFVFSFFVIFLGWRLGLSFPSMATGALLLHSTVFLSLRLCCGRVHWTAWHKRRHLEHLLTSVARSHYLFALVNSSSTTLVT